MKKCLKTALAATVALLFVLNLSSVWAKDSPPLEAFKKLGAAAEKKDWGSFYDGCEKSTQQTIGQLFLFALALGTMDSPEKQKKMEAELGAPPTPGQEKKIDRATFIKLMKLMDEIGDSKDEAQIVPKNPEITEKDLKADRAVLSVKDPGKPAPEDVVMVLEEGAWKFFMANPFEEAMKQQKGGAGQTSSTAPGADTSSSTAPSAGTGQDADQKAKETIKKFFKNQ
ncbi:MAG: hypothetical protein HQK55_07290 [Deltaproteobacteria bacterium]|nr:hypothetical protein [Deltaproteobacteria bacterium]